MMPAQASSAFRGLFKLAFAVPVAAAFVLTGCGGGDATPVEEQGTPPDLDPMIQMEDTTSDPTLDVDDAGGTDPAISG